MREHLGFNLRIIANKHLRRLKPECGSFRRNASRRLAPAITVLVAPTIYAMIFPAESCSALFRLIWLALAVPSFTVGAMLMTWARRR